MTDHIDEAINKAKKLLADRDKGNFSFSGSLCVELAEALLTLAQQCGKDGD